MKAAVIVNADDFGLSVDTVAATIERFEQGALTSATIMPNMVATDDAVAYARGHPEFSFGVHLTFAGRGDERPLCAPSEVPALVTDSGCFPPSNSVRLRAMARRIPTDQICRELEAQITRITDEGILVSHVDSHFHLHKFAPFLAALEITLPRFHIQRVRAAQDWYIAKQYRRPTYWYGHVWKRRIQHRFKTTDHFFMPSAVSDADRIEALVPRITGGTLEVGGHPGPAGWRHAEGQALGRFASAASAAGHALVTWRDV